MKVCLAPHRQAIKVRWQESPGSSEYLSESRRKVFLDQVSACGMEAAENSDAPILTVTIQVTPSKALLIANSAESVNGPPIYVVEIPRASLLVPRDPVQTPQLRRELVWRQEKPIQSAMEWQDPVVQERFLFLLSDGLFQRFHFENNAWRWMDSADLPAAGRRSRSGETTFFYSHAKERVELVLGKEACDFNLSEHVSFTCGGVEPGDRTAELLSSCEESPRYLLVGRGDYTQADRIRLAVAATPSADESYSGSLGMPGPVLDISTEENAKAAFAVVRNLSTGNYEVYRITAVCSN